MEVNHVIKELLYDHNCVIIPGFGAFIANEVSTRVHPITKSFTPPSKGIAFNRSLKKNDGLLIKEFAIHYKISDKESESKVNSYASELEKRIQNEKIVRIEDIGTFKVDGEGNIQFKADDSVNFLDESFGLPELHIKPIKKELNMTQQPDAPRRAPIRNTPKEEKKEVVQEESSATNKLFLIIPIALVLVGVLSLFFVKDGEGNVYMAGLIHSLKSNTEIVSDDHEEVDADDYAHEMEEDSHHDSDHDAISESAHRYHIIAGVFSEKENADNLLETVAHGEILHIGGYYKVSITSFDSEVEAEADLSHYTGEFGNDIWVLEE